MHGWCYRLELLQPLLQQHEMEALKHLAINGWRTCTLDATWAAQEGPDGLEAALQRLADEANAAIDEGYSFLALSDRSAGVNHLCCLSCWWRRPLVAPPSKT